MLKSFRLSAGILLVACLLVVRLSSLSAQAKESEPVVFAVLFFSPTCPHCHEVIENHVPLWQEEFGDALQLLFVDVTQQGGTMLFYDTCNTLGVESCGSVPMLVIGETVMIGAAEIPARTPGLVHDGLASGGIGLPPVPQLQQIYNQLVAAEELAADEPDAAETAIDSNTSEIATEAAVQTEAAASPSWIDKVKRDSEGNAVAIVVLMGLVASLVMVIWRRPSGIIIESNVFVSRAQMAILLGGIVVSGSLLAESSGDTLAMAMSGGILILMLWSAIAIVMSEFAEWMVPLAAGAGLLDAIYLMQVETTDSSITCGLIGDCGTVQQSQYAELFGVLSIGTLGVIVYAAILILWAMSQLRNDPADYADAALFGTALIGVGFSIYLTFLEPFVIGATCMWCITSALMMLLLLWLTAPSGWAAIRRLRDPGQGVQQIHPSA